MENMENIKKLADADFDGDTVMVTPDEETLMNESFNPKKFYKEHPEFNTVAMTGYFGRMLKRRNTIHLRGVCPNCGRTNMKFRKILYGKPIKHDIWYCSRCGKTAKRGDLEYVRYS